MSFETDNTDNLGPDEGDRPLLSFTIIARDDDYMPDFHYRLATTINHLGRSLRAIGRHKQAEIVITDWASPTPLIKTLPLDPEAAAICRFAYVPPTLVQTLYGAPGFFHRAVAMNAAVRRARGMYIVNYAADTLILRASLDSLFGLLEGRTIFDGHIDQAYLTCSRYRVPWQFVATQPTVEQWDRFLLLSGAWLERESAALLSMSKGVGAYLMHRRLWHELRGFDENLPSWGWHEVELASRATQRYPWIELSAMGVCVYHMEHPPIGQRATIVASDPNPQRFHAEFCINAEDWGLGRQPLVVQPHEPNSRVRARRKEYRDGDIVNRRGASEPEIRQTLRRRPKIDGPEVRQEVHRVVDMAATLRWPVHREDYDALFFLCWYAAGLQDGRYLEFGGLRGLGLLAAARRWPCGETYVVDRWEGILSNRSPLHIEAVLRRRLGFAGYLRFLNGETATGLERLRTALEPPNALDLIFLRLKEVGGAAESLLSGSLEALRPGGALVVCGNDIGHMGRIWGGLPGLRNDLHLCRSSDGRAGIALVPSADASQTDVILPPEVPLPLGGARFVYQRRRLRAVTKAALQPSRYADLARRTFDN